MRRLATEADVVVENFKVGGLDKFGLDAKSLRAANPRLIYASITGFGQDGPYANRAGYDFIIQGMGGMMSITGIPDGEPGGGPMRAGVAIADLFTGMYTATAILAALYGREKSGEGAHIDLALFDTQLAVLANQAANALVSGKDPPRQGNTHPNIVPYQPFDAADQPIIIAVGNDRQFARLAAICGHPEWVEDERFASNEARVANRAAMVPLVAETISGKPAAAWLEQLEQAGIPAGPINRISQALADVQAQHRAMVRTISGCAAGRVAGAARRRARGFGAAAAEAWAAQRGGPGDARARAARGRAAQVRRNRRLVAVANLAGAVDQQIELFLATILDQHLSGADQIVGRQGIDGDDVELARIGAIRPFDPIFDAADNRQRGRPWRQRAAGGPGQVLRAAVGRPDLDRHLGFLVRAPGLHRRGIADANLPAFGEIDVPDARVVRDFRGAESAEAPALGGRRGQASPAWHRNCPARASSARSPARAR